MAHSNKKGWLRRLNVLIQLKLIVPLKRAKTRPEIIARGVLVGMVWAMTPLVGIQMYLVIMTWMISKKLFKWNFNVPVALAWTWVTNVFTLPFFYYSFYITGKALRGEISTIVTFKGFCGMVKNITNNSSTLEALKELCTFMLKDAGVSMCIGSIPWMIVCGGISYLITINYLRKRIANRALRLEKKRSRIENKINKFDNKISKIENKQQKLTQKLETTQNLLEFETQKKEREQNKC
ncbi:MAG: DUF2062 domain-containing protein [Alphaproteobacteria bacterium]|nr:DUF2062 domain-containing protein [Alphaproteobacteria bacterium]